MTIMTDSPALITVGVDTHGEVHVAAALDHLGGVIAVADFSTTAAGYRELLAWARSHGPLGPVGVEGTGAWGVGLSRYLRGEGVEVLEVCRPNRQLRRRRGKDDAIDAIAAARAVLAGEAIGPAKDADGAMEAMRVLRVVRRSAHKERTASINQLRALVVNAPETLRDQLRTLTGRQLVNTAARLRPGTSIDATSATKLALRSLARRVQGLNAEIADCDRLLRELILEVAPTMLDHHAVGVDTASALLVSAGDNPDRLRHEAAWARLCGVAPIPASSGARHRYRLNRGGDRQANAALWRIVLVRMGTHEPTRTYVARRTAEGLSKREIMRCLKLRGAARHYEEHGHEIERSLAAGRSPRRAHLVADRDPKGRWIVSREHLAEFLERRRPPAVRVAYDLTLTTEKSLGVLALLGDTPTRDAVLGAIQSGNDWAIGWLEDHAAVGRVDGKPVPAEGLAVASFRHLTSRALDPFPHHHNVIVNTARIEDGTHRGLWSRPLYANAQAASALATAEMRHQLSATLGVRWRPGRTGGWEIDGITPQVIREFSKRRTEINDALAELEAEIGRGAHPREVEHIVLRTRPAKQHTPTDDLVASWHERAARHGLTPDTLAAVTGRERVEQTVDAGALFASLAAPGGICAGGSVFTRADALTALANHPVRTGEGGPQPLLCGAERVLELTDQFLASRHIVRLTEGHAPLYTTVDMLQTQERIATRFAKGLHRGAHLVADRHIDAVLARHPHLTDEQRQLVTEWCQRGHRYATAIGRAGAGKTTTVATCADAWTAAGYRVVGAAVKGEATRTLAAATGIECETVAWYLAHTDPQTLPLDARTILIVDEASTLSDRDLDALMTMASTTGASLRLIGDPAQHSAIAAGGMFRVLCERHPNQTPELTTTHRLQHPDDRAAAEALREGRIDEAFDRLAAAGHLHVMRDDLDMYRHVLGRWWDAHRQGVDHPMVDRRNTTRQQLNHLAHLLRRVHGELGDQTVAASGNRTFAVGDRVTARAPNRELHVEGDRLAYVRNGALGTVVAIQADPRGRARDTLTVDFDGIGRINIPRSFFDHHPTRGGRAEVGIDHAYALTSYAVQGSTRDVSTSRVDATATRAETYVDITRGRHENHLYVTAATDPLDGEALPRVPPVPADFAVAERLHRSTGELTAWEFAHPADQQAAVGRAIGI